MKLISVLSLVCLLLVPLSASAQTRPRTAARRRTPPTARARNTNTGPKSATALNEARLRVGEKIKLLTRFLYLYARASRDLETAQTQAQQAGPGATQVTSSLDKSRATLRANVQNVRAGLDELELYFKTTPEAERYYQSIAGVAATVAAAEDKVAAGQLDAAGRALLDVINRLTDVLLEMG